MRITATMKATLLHDHGVVNIQKQQILTQSANLYDGVVYGVRHNSSCHNMPVARHTK